eukprot:COSAG02_NODE_8138_length_2694_cov_2.468593_2_plen_402_part_00
MGPNSPQRAPAAPQQAWNAPATKATAARDKKADSICDRLKLVLRRWQITQVRNGKPLPAFVLVVVGAFGSLKDVASDWAVIVNWYASGHTGWAQAGVWINIIGGGLAGLVLARELFNAAKDEGETATQYMCPLVFLRVVDDTVSHTTIKLSNLGSGATEEVPALVPGSMVQRCACDSEGSFVTTVEKSGEVIEAPVRILWFQKFLFDSGRPIVRWASSGIVELIDARTLKVIDAQASLKKFQDELGGGSRFNATPTTGEAEELLAELARVLRANEDLAKRCWWSTVGEVQFDMTVVLHAEIKAMWRWADVVHGGNAKEIGTNESIRLARALRLLSKPIAKEHHAKESDLVALLVHGCVVSNADFVAGCAQNRLRTHEWFEKLGLHLLDSDESIFFYLLLGC